MGNIDAEYNAKMSDLRSLSSEYTRVEEAQVADEAALAKERREQNRIKPEDGERLHKQYGGLRPDDPYKIARVEEMAQTGQIPNTEEAKRSVINDFDPRMEAKNDIELGQQKVNLENATLRHTMNTQLSAGRAALTASKTLGASLNNQLKALQIDAAKMKNANAPSVAAHANTLAQLRIQRAQGANKRDALKAAVAANNHADSVSIQSAKLKQNVFGAKDPSVDEEEKRLDAEAKALREDARKTIDNLAAGKNPEDDGEPTPAKSAPAANKGNVPAGALEYYQAHKNDKVTIDGKQITQREAFSRHFKVDPEALTGG
jgi:hypothetical protein